MSVIIPTYNRADLLPRAIRSVLAQTFTDFELIVVDDGSIDNTREVVDKFTHLDARVKYIWEPNSGRPAVPKNKGIENASGEYIAFLDHDDEWLPAKLEKQLILFNNIPGNVGLVACDYLAIADGMQRVLRTHRLPGYLDKDNFFVSILREDFISTTSIVIIPIHVLKRVGVFDANLKYADDWEMWMRIGKEYSFARVDEFLVKYYVHGMNTMKKQSPIDYAETLRYVLTKHQDKCRKYYRVYSRKLGQLAGNYSASGMLSQGRHYYFLSVRANPMNIKSYFSLAASLLLGKQIFIWIYHMKRSVREFKWRLKLLYRRPSSI
ncbi:MAG: glycosyltransferase family 2 protein [Candidatus Kryptoniota bacterium]